MKRIVSVGVALVVSLLLLAGCGGRTSGTSSGSENKDPHRSWVAKFDNADGGSRVWYRCDEKGTGFYMAWSNQGGVDVVPNSPDCVRG